MSKLDKFTQSVLDEHGHNKVIQHYRSGSLRMLNVNRAKVTAKREAKLIAYCTSHLSAKSGTDLVEEFLRKYTPRYAKDKHNFIDNMWNTAFSCTCPGVTEWFRSACDEFEDEIQTAMRFRDCDGKVHAALASRILTECAIALKKDRPVPYTAVFTTDGLYANPAIVIGQMGIRATTLNAWKVVDSFAQRNSLWGKKSMVRLSEAAYCQYHITQQREGDTAVLFEELANDTAKLILEDKYHNPDIEAGYQGVCHICSKTPDSSSEEESHRLLCRKRMDGSYLVTSQRMARLEGYIRLLAQQRRKLSYAEFMEAFDADLKAAFESQSGCSCPVRWLVRQAFEKMELDHRPTNEQVDAVVMQLYWTVSAVTAPAGTGKTDVVTAIFDQCMQMLDIAPVYATPTHAAKKPLCEALKIHKNTVSTLSLLTFRGGETPYGMRSILDSYIIDKKADEYTDKDSYLDEYEDAGYDHVSHRASRVHVLIDEAGMVGSEVLGELCEILLDSKYSQLTITVSMVGDLQQLPPVSLGEPLFDLVQASIIPVAKLTKVFRTLDHNLIRLASMYRGESYPIPRPDIQGKVWGPSVEVHSANGSIALANRFRSVLEACKRDGYVSASCDTVADDKKLMIICPFNGGRTSQNNEGCIELAHIVRSVFRPDTHRHRSQGQHFMVGDKVMFVKNTPWYKNGDTAKVHKIKDIYKDGSVSAVVGISLHKNESNKLHSLMKVRGSLLHTDDLPEHAIRLTDDGMLTDKNHDWEFHIHSKILSPVDCITVHKAQGAQSQRVIFVAPDGLKRSRMCNSRLLYTSITRSRHSFFAVGDIVALEGTAMMLEPKRKLTTLAHLCEEDVAVDLPPCDVSVIYATTRPKIPQSLRLQVWQKRFGHSMKGECYACKCPLYFTQFHAAHVIAHSRGGDLSLDNLEASCAGCNLACQTMNFDEYKIKMQRKRKSPDTVNREGDVLETTKRVRPEVFTAADENQMMNAISENMSKTGYRVGDKAMISGTKGGVLPEYTVEQRSICIEYMLQQQKICRVYDPYPIFEIVNPTWSPGCSTNI